jgi:hypothetical protein
VVKPVFDGVVASFHQHSSSDSEVSRRLALSFDAGLNEINAGLHDGEYDILGTRTLLQGDKASSGTPPMIFALPVSL